MPSIVLAPVMGVLVDRYGRRIVLIPCLVGYGVTGAAVAFTPSFSAILVLRFLQGCAASGLLTLSLTLIGDLFDGPRRNAVMGLNAAAMTGGVAVYPILGGLLADIAWNVPFAAYGVSVFIGAVAFAVLEEPTVEQSRFGLEYFRGTVARITTGSGLALYGAVFLTFFVFFGAINTSIPFLLEQDYALSASVIGLVLSVPLVMSTFVALTNGRLARYLSNGRLIGIGFVGYGIGLAGIWMTESAMGVAATLVVLGAGYGLIVPSLDTGISGLAPDAFRGGVMSLRLSVKKVGQTIGPVLFPLVAAVAGYPRLLLITGLLTAIVGFVTAWISHR